MRCRLAAAQCAHAADGDASALARRWALRAQAAEANMLVFPECLMTPFETSPADFAASAQPLDGPFGCAMADIARDTGLWIVYTANERGPEGAKPYNTLVVVDAEGTLRGAYRKTHLFDAGSFVESEKTGAGDAIFDPVQTPWFCLGAGICYDLRFPELARRQALAGAELMVFPSAWVAGPRKVEHWKTLIRARAIENEVYVAGVCRSGSGCSGHSLIVDPRGEILACADTEEEELLVATIDTALVQAARAEIPVFEHRRADLY